MLVLEKLSKSYALPNKSHVVALNEVSLQFADKGMVFIVGKSGCGKSTLLNVLGGLDKFDSGELYFNGKSFKDFKDGEYEDYRNHNVGFVFQESNLLEGFSVGENLALAVELQGKVADKAQIDEILHSVDLDGIANRKVTALSGGQKQRVAVARALIKNSEIILADEPTGNLDSTSAKELFDILKEISKDKLVIVVSHDTESANAYGDRIVEMSDGKVIRDENAPESVSAVEENTDGKKVKKGRLKFPKMLKLSARNLKARVIRLIVMIFLFSTALGFFGTGLSAYGMDIIKIYDNAFHNLGSKSLTLNWVEIAQYSIGDLDKYLTQEEISDFEEKVGYKTLPIYRPNENERLVNVNRQESGNGGEEDYFYGDADRRETSGFVCLDGVDLSEYGLEIIAGSLPQNGEEIAVSYYEFLLYQKFGVYGDKEFNYTTPEAILGKRVNCYHQDRTIVGVIDTGIDLSQYEELKTPYSETSMKAREYYNLLERFNNELYNSLHKAIFINLEMLNATFSYYTHTFNSYSYQVDGKVYIENEVEGIRFIKGKTKLFAGEIAISRRELLEEMYINKMGMEPWFFGIAWQSGEFDEIDISKLLTELSSENFKITRTIRDTATGRDAEAKEFRVVGIAPEEKVSYICSEDFLKYYLPAEDCVTAFAVGCAKNPERYQYLAELAGKVAIAYGDDTIKKAEMLNVNSALSRDVNNVEYQRGGFVKLGLLASIAFGVFSIIMILNFFIVTIKDKHKEIGILLALGTGKKTIFAIYFIEALIVSLISVVLGICFTAIINRILELAIFFVPFRVIMNSFFGVAMTFLLGLFVAFIGSAAPIFAISRRKPAEVIRS